MNIIEYIKHRLVLLLAIICGGGFAFTVYWADGSSAVLYALQGIGVIVVVFLVIDFLMLRSRIKKMGRFLLDEVNEITVPLDKAYAKMIGRVIGAHKAYRYDMETQHAREIEFISKWVHDVKVPISAIRLIADGTDDEIAQQLEMQTLFVEQNIQKILFHIKSKRFYEDYTIKQTDIKAIVTAALKQYAVFFAYKKIALTLDCEDIKVATDEKWSGYIISQVISNAVKYTSNGGAIDICAYYSGEKAIVSVKNTGIGIDETNKKHMFKRGFSGSVVRKGASTGYGLYLSKKLANIMGHALYAESVPGEYAEFFLEFNVTKS